MLEHDMDFGQVQGSSHGISVAFAKKMGWDFHRIWSHFRTKLLSKRHEKIRVTFFTGKKLFLVYFKTSVTSLKMHNFKLTFNSSHVPKILKNLQISYSTFSL